MNSLRGYLFSRLLLLISPLIAIQMLVHWRLEKKLLEHQFHETLVEKACVLATLVTDQGGRLMLNFADEFMPEFSVGAKLSCFQIWASDGSTLERSFSLGGANLPYGSGTLESPYYFERVLNSGLSLRGLVIEFPVRTGNEQQPDSLSRVAIGVATDVTALERNVQRAAIQVTLVGVLLVCLISIAVLMALKKGVRLLEAVAEDVGTASPNSSTPLLELSKSPREIRPIVTSLNSAIESIRSSVAREKRFNSDVAHELRTPIAELRSAADVAMRWPGEESSQVLATHAQAIAIQMQGIVDGLLELVLLEAVEAGAEGEPFDLRERVELLAELAQRGAQGQRTIEFTGPPQDFVASNSKLWDIALRNLLENAMAHSLPGSTTRVDFQPTPEGLRITISNPTESIDAEGARRCLDRLWRANANASAEGHFGLGLSIVQASLAKLGHALEVRLEAGIFYATIQPENPAHHQVQ